MPLRPSRVLALAVLAGHFLALGCVWLTVPVWGAAIASGGLVLSAVACTRMSAHLPRALVLHADGTLDCIDADGMLQPAELTRSSVPTWWLATVALRDRDGRRLSLALLPDSSDPQSLRRLRAWLGNRPPTFASPVRRQD